MGNAAIVGVILVAITLIGGAYAYYLTIPNLEVQMIFTEKNAKNTQNVEILVATDDARFSKTSKVCFEIKNKAEAISDYEVKASNFKVSVTTENAECENCNINSLERTLAPQEIEPICKKIGVSRNTEEFTIHVKPQYVALGTDNSNVYRYKCEKIEELENQNQYLCSLLQSNIAK